MVYSLTYTPDVLALTARGLELCAEGKWKQYMEAVEVDKDGDGVPDGISLSMPKVSTAYAMSHTPTALDSLCLIKLPLKDIIGDPEDLTYVSFCEDLGLEVLAYGVGNYEQVQLDPIALEKYRKVLPDTEVTDSDGNGTGEFHFTYWIEFDASIRS